MDRVNFFSPTCMTQHDDTPLQRGKKAHDIWLCMRFKRLLGSTWTEMPKGFWGTSLKYSFPHYMLIRHNLLVHRVHNSSPKRYLSSLKRVLHFSYFCLLLKYIYKLTVSNIKENKRKKGKKKKRNTCYNTLWKHNMRVQVGIKRKTP